MNKIWLTHIYLQYIIFHRKAAKLLTWPDIIEVKYFQNELSPNILYMVEALSSLIQYLAVFIMNNKQ